MSTARRERIGMRRLVAAAMLCLGQALPAAVRAEEPSEPEAGYQQQDQRDPFVPLVRDGRVVGMFSGEGPAGSAPQLRGIVWDSSGASIALIGDRELRTGDMLGKYQVKEIRQDGVVLLRDGQELFLQLPVEGRMGRGWRTGGVQP